MVLFIIDVDCGLSHAASGGHGDMPAPDDWWLQELEKLERLLAAFPVRLSTGQGEGIGSSICS
jgi:hypothetical protein